ncbi:MAG TPA: hypothetical protein VHD95_16765 [Rhizomicrobium sp.]|nr:hypothetical protein [Rhizomicrobium sp.]
MPVAEFLVRLLGGDGGLQFRRQKLFEAVGELVARFDAHGFRIPVPEHREVCVFGEPGVILFGDGGLKTRDKRGLAGIGRHGGRGIGCECGGCAEREREDSREHMLEHDHPRIGQARILAQICAAYTPWTISAR